MAEVDSIEYLDWRSEVLWPSGRRFARAGESLREQEVHREPEDELGPTTAQQLCNVGLSREFTEAAYGSSIWWR